MAEFLIGAIISAGAAIGGTVGAFAIMNASAIATGTLLVGSVALSAAQRNKAKRAAKAAYNASQVDRLANYPATAAPRELVLGRVRKGGHVSFRESVGTNRSKFVVLLSLAGHECDGIEAIWLNDQRVTLDVNGYVTDAPYAGTTTSSYTETFGGSSITLAHAPVADSVQVTRAGSEGSAETVAHTLSGSTVTIGDSLGGTVTYQSQASGSGATIGWHLGATGHVVSKAKISWHLGAPGQVADADMLTLFPSDWSADHTGTGICYLKAEFVYDETAFPNGGVNITVELRGAKLYDPRTGLTVWSENPALMMRHVLTHPYFGKRASVTAEEDADIVAAANACDTSHTYTLVSDSGTTTETVALYRAALVVPFGTAPADALDDLAQAMAGRWVYAAGRLRVKAGVYEAPVLTLTDDDLVAQVQGQDGALDEREMVVTPHRPRNEKLNTVTVRIWDQDQDFKETPLTPLVGSALVTRDGQSIVEEVPMPAVGYAPQALHIAGVMMRDARDPLACTLTFKWAAYRVELLDTIALTLSRFGWASKAFVVTDRTNNGDGTFTLGLKETAAAIFQPDAEFVAQGYASNTDTPPPWDIDPPTITSVTDRAATYSDGSLICDVVVAFNALTDASQLAGEVEVQWQVPGNAWQSVKVPGTSTEAVLPALRDNTVIIVRARTITRAAVSDWCTHVTHTVNVASATPENYDTFTVTFLADGTRVFTFAYTTTTPPADLAGAMFRWKAAPTGTETWDDLFELNSGPVIDSPREIRAGDPGAYRFACRAITRSGVLCDVADTRYVNVTLPELLSGTPMLQLLADGNTMSFTSAGAAYPAAQSIEFTAVVSNTTGTPTWYAEAFNELGVSQGAVSLTGSGLTRTMSSAQFLADPDTQFVVVWVELGDLIAVQRVVRLTDGGEPIITLLYPQQIVLPATAAGVVTDWSNAVSQFWVTVGQSAVTSGVTYSLAPSGNPSGLTYTLGSTTGAIAITAAGSWPATSDEATITFRATHDATGLYRDLPLKITKARTGVAGVSAVLSNEAHAFPADTAGAVTSYTGSGTLVRVFEGSTELTYDGVGTSAGTWTFSTSATNITRGSITDSGAYATVGDHSGVASGTDTASIVYTITGKNAAGTAFTVTKTQTFTKSKTGSTGNTGAAATTVVLSRPAHVFPADSSGAVTSYTGSGTTIRVYEGSTELSYDGVGSSNGTWTFSSSATNITRGSITDSGAFATIGDHSGVASGTDTASITYTISGKTAAGATVSLTAVQSFSKAKAGTNGTNGTNGTRGSRTLYDTSVSYTASYNNGAGAGAASYKAQATSLIATATSGTTPTAPIKGDTVTFSNGSTYVVTYTNDGTYGTNGNNSWTLQTYVLDGSLLVTGSVAASALTAGTVTSMGGAGDLYLGQSDMLAQFVRPNSGAVKTTPLVYIIDQYASASTGPALQVVSNYGKVIYGVVASTNATDRPFEFVDGFVLTTGEFLTARSYRTAIYALNSFYSTGAKLATPSWGADITGGIKVSGAFGVNGSTPQTKYTLPAAATDAATTQALANAIRTALINCGIAV